MQKDPAGIADAAAAWLQTHLHCLQDLLAGNEKQVFRRLKATNEILLLELNISPQPDPAIVSALLQALANANQGRRLQRHFWQHLDLDILARSCMGVMQEFGCLPLDDPLQAAILTWLDICYKERFPWRNLETEFIGRKFHQLPGSLQEMPLNGEFLGARLPRGMNDEYGLTHALFYSSDFGQQDPALAVDRAALAARIESLCAQSLLCNNLDLLAEHLLTLRHLGLEKAELAHWYAEQICARSVQDEAGRVYWLGPFNMQAVLEKEGFAQDEWAFLENYHVTFLLRHFLQGLRGAPRQRYCAPAGFGLAPQPAVPQPDGVLADLMRGQGDDQALHALLQREASATPALLAWWQALRLRQAQGAALPSLPQSLSYLRELQDLPLQYARPERLLLQILLQTVVCVYDGGRMPAESLATLEQSYLQCSAGMPTRDGKVLLLPAARLLLAAQAVADCNGEKLSPVQQIGVQGVLSMALRQRDLCAIVLALVLHAWRATPPCAQDRQLAHALFMASLQLLPAAPAAEPVPPALHWIELGLHLVQTWPASAS